MKLLQRIILKFKHAFNGLEIGLLKDRSIQIQVMFMLIAFVISAILNISLNDWIIIIIVSSLVVAAEFFNSSIELLSDYASDNKYSKIIKEVKDLSAAAVFVFAVCALVVGIMIFLKYIL